MQGDPVDLAQMQSIMQTIEQACSSIQMHVNPATAETTILYLSQSPKPYQACKFILEHSKVANARFQAASAVSVAAIREWAVLTSDDKKSLINFCLCYIMQHASSLEGYVRSKVSSVAAQLMKRGWLEFTGAEKETFLVEVKRAVIGCHGIDVQNSGIIFLESLVSELSPSSSSAMALPREYHENCRKSFELEYLKTFYTWAQEAAIAVTNRIIESNSSVPEANVCAAALRLMCQILSWEFQCNSSRGSETSINVFSDIRQDTSSPKKSECVLPGPSWREILITSGHVGWLLSFYGALRPKFSLQGYWLDCPLAVSARKLILQLCSLTGAVFPSDNIQMQEHHLIQLLSGVLPWVYPPDRISQELECGKSESPFGTISLLSALMSEVVKDLMNKNTEEETWSWVARDILLDTWTALLAPNENGSWNVEFPVEGLTAAANLFELIVESELKAASSSAFNDDDSGIDIQASIFAMDERLSSYGLIARASVERSVPLLTRVFLERFARLQQGRGTADPTATLEELYSLLLICGHVLADEGEGEAPLVPELIQTNFRDNVEPDKHPSIDPEIRASFFSPRLMEAIIWFLARWSGTYLMPPKSCTGYDNSGRKSSFGFFEEHNQGKFILNSIVQISISAMMSYPGEKNLQELTCRQLLHVLVRRKEICTHLIVLDPWTKFAYTFATESNLILLNAAHQRSLAQSFVLSAAGIKNSDTSNQYIKNMMSHMTAYLVDLTGKDDLDKVAEKPDTIMTVTCILERLRGAASASNSQTRKAIYEIGSAVNNALLLLLRAYKHESAVVYLILKFVVQWVDGQISFIEAKEAALVINFCMCLLKLYSDLNIGKISLIRSSTLANEEKAEKYKDLRALIQLLTVLCTKDMVVYSGLHIIAPLVSLELLKFPKLCHDYFSLLSHMLEVYPEMIAQLTCEAFAHIMGTLDFSLRVQDSDVVYMSLRATKALAAYHYKETAIGRTGLGLNATGFMDANGKHQEGFLSRSLSSLLQFLLFEDYSSEIVSEAADALLPLILSEQALFQRLGHELIERQTDPGLKTRLANALHMLTTENQLTSALDRINYQRFRKNLRKFLIEVRGFLRTM
ncbi:hypothetical protein V2J09_019678 [Rumex salicifolius]